jgi:hypothetical protein
MTKEGFLSDDERLIVGAHVEGFRNVLQFPEMKRKTNEFHIDCHL